MVQRYANTRVQSVATAGFMYRAIPVGRFPVAPGTTLDELRATVSISVGAIRRVLMENGQLDVWAFYVPHRLVLGLDTWSSVLEGDTSVATTNTPDPYVFEGMQGVAPALSILGRASFRTLYNAYFGTEDYSSWAWYTDVLSAAATDRNKARLRSLEQMVYRTQSNSSVTDTTLNIPVSGANAVLSLNEFRKAMARSRSKRLQQVSGDKYADILQQFGVNPSWSIQMNPEYLGHAKASVKPRTIRATVDSDTGLGSPTSIYEGSVDLKLSSRFFAEHGLIWLVAGFRPKLLRRDSSAVYGPGGPLDAWDTARDHFFWPVNVQTGESIVTAKLGLSSATGAVYATDYHRLRSGQNLQGDVKEGGDLSMLTTVPTTNANLLYPDVQEAMRPLGGGNSDLPMAVHCRTYLKESTPVPPKRVA